MSALVRLFGFTLACVCLLQQSMSVDAQPPRSTIKVVGEAEASVKPDKVLITATIETKAEDVAGVRLKHSEATEQILSFLKEQGIKPEQIKTSLLEINLLEVANESYSKKAGNRQQPQNQRAEDDNPFSGDTEDQTNGNQGSGNEATVIAATKTSYVARREVAVTLTELTKFEDIYCGLLTRGVRGSPDVVLQNNSPQTFLNRVSEEAVKVAKERARVVAFQLNSRATTRLTAIDTIVESRSGGSILGMHDPFGGGPTFSMNVGEIVYHAKVNVVFQMSDADLK